MSRLGKKAIPLANGVEVKVDGNVIHVKGPKGSLSFPLVHGINVKVENNQALVECFTNENDRPFHGLYRALLNNMVIGVTQGFEKRLTMTGVGYRASVQGTNLDLLVGNSHPTLVPIPANLTVAVEKGTQIKVSGIDKQLVGQFAATVRAVKKPEPYKGKGISYEGEVIRRKAGKAAKSKTSG